MKRLTRLLTVTTSLALLAPIAVACPFCAENVASTDTASPASVPAGFNLSIYVVLITFGLVLAGVVLSMVQATRRR